MIVKFFLRKVDGGIEIRARMEAEDGTVGDFIETVRPGDDLWGVPYADVEAALPAGYIELAED
jgi:hypothetical protein